MFRMSASRPQPGVLSPRSRPSTPQSLHQDRNRSIVSMPTLQALKRMPWFPVAVSAFRIQEQGACVDNAESTQEQLLTDLYRRNQIDAQLPVPDGKVAQTVQRLQQKTGLGKPRYEPTMQTMLDPGAEDIARLVKEHGPVSVSMASALGPQQGAETYTSHHAMVVLCTFQHEGRHVAVVLDGNDLQSNPLMVKARAYAEQHGIPLEGLTALDFLNIQNELDDDKDIAQLPFRLIDLDTVVSNSRAKQKAFEDYQRQGGTPGDPGEPLPVTHPNSVRWASDATVKTDPLPPQALAELEAVCRAHPNLIEFGAAQPSLNRDE